MHYICPGASCWASDYHKNWDVEACKVCILIVDISEFLLWKKVHADNAENKPKKQEENEYINNISEWHKKSF